jgi:hypothetical protein
MIIINYKKCDKDAAVAVAAAEHLEFMRGYVEGFLEVRVTHPALRNTTPIEELVGRMTDKSVIQFVDAVRAGSTDSELLTVFMDGTHASIEVPLPLLEGCAKNRIIESYDDELRAAK